VLHPLDRHVFMVMNLGSSRTEGRAFGDWSRPVYINPAHLDVKTYDAHVGQHSTKYDLADLPDVINVALQTFAICCLS
jgi:hypothetical protein